MKKFFAILLSAMLMLSLAVPAMAEGENPVTYKITVPDTDSHTYEVYQIFTGDYHNGILSNLVWGKNGKGTENEKVDNSVLDALEAVTNSSSDSAKLAVINNYVNLSSEEYGTVSSASSLTGVAPGYYLLKDANSLNGADDAYTTYIVQIVDNVEVARKAAKPSVDKQVWDESTDDDDHEKGDDYWGETADHEINESFKFKLTATIPADKDFAAYKTYKVVFNDTMSAGITFESIDSVKVNGTPITEYTETATNAENKAGITWSLTINDIIEYDSDLTDGATIEVIYNAHLNENAVIGDTDANLNKVYLEYSNNPNADGEGDLGKTEEDTVWVFTYQVNVTKVDGEKTDKYLEGAEFKMKNAKDEWLVVDENGKVQRWVASKDDATVLKSDANGKFSVIGLDHGTYQLIETKAPAGYNLLDTPIDVIINATHAENENTITASTNFKVNNADSITVENNAGATLPETGGIGTTIFYTVGGLMVVAAVVLLVTKKRMSAEG